MIIWWKGILRKEYSVCKGPGVGTFQDTERRPVWLEWKELEDVGNEIRELTGSRQNKREPLEGLDKGRISGFCFKWSTL